MNELGEIFRGGAEQARIHFDAQIERICLRLETIAESVDAQDARRETLRREVSAPADAAGIAVLEFEQLRPGYIWQVERISTVVANGAGSIAAVYAGSLRPGALTHVIEDADFYAADVNRIIVPLGGRLIVRISAAPVGSTCTASVQTIVTEAEKHG